MDLEQAASQGYSQRVASPALPSEAMTASEERTSAESKSSGLPHREVTGWHTQRNATHAANNARTHAINNARQAHTSMCFWAQHRGTYASNVTKHRTHPELHSTALLHVYHGVLYTHQHGLKQRCDCTRRLWGLCNVNNCLPNRVQQLLIFHRLRCDCGSFF